MKIRIRQNLVAGGLFTLFSLAIWFMIPYHIAVTEEGFNAQFFPKLVVGAMFILSIILMISSLQNKNEKILELDLTKELQISLFALTMFAYIFLITKIGFILASVGFSITSVFLLQGKKYYILVVTLLSLVVYVAFKYLLHIQLPSLLS